MTVTHRLDSSLEAFFFLRQIIDNYRRKGKKKRKKNFKVKFNVFAYIFSRVQEPQLHSVLVDCCCFPSCYIGRYKKCSRLNVQARLCFEYE